LQYAGQKIIKEIIFKQKHDGTHHILRGQRGSSSLEENKNIQIISLSFFSWIDSFLTVRKKIRTRKKYDFFRIHHLSSFFCQNSKPRSDTNISTAKIQKAKFSDIYRFFRTCWMQTNGQKHFTVVHLNSDNIKLITVKLYPLQQLGAWRFHTSVKITDQHTTKITARSTNKKNI